MGSVVHAFQIRFLLSLRSFLAFQLCFSIIFLFFFFTACFGLFSFCENSFGDGKQLLSCTFVVAILVQTPFSFLDCLLGMKQAVFETMSDDLFLNQLIFALEDEHY